MDFTQSNDWVAGTPPYVRKHKTDQTYPTRVTDNDINGLTWEVMSVILWAGITPVAFDAANPASYQQLRDAINTKILALAPDLSPYALKTYVDTAISNLVNSSPAALDTLNELATALGNDANFATTVNTALSNRLRFDAAQILTAAQKAQALSNLGLTSPSKMLANVKNSTHTVLPVGNTTLMTASFTPAAMTNGVAHYRVSLGAIAPSQGSVTLMLDGTAVAQSSRLHLGPAQGYIYNTEWAGSVYLPTLSAAAHTLTVQCTADNGSIRFNPGSADQTGWANSTSELIFLALNA